MSRTLRSLTSPELLSLSTRLALLVHLSTPLSECATRLNLTLPATKRLLRRPETQSSLATLAARSLSAVSRAETDILTRSHTAFIVNLEAAVAELVRVALTDPMCPYPTKLSALIEILDRAGLSKRLADHATNTDAPDLSLRTPEMTTDLLDSLTHLVKAITSTTPPPSEPPQLPESYRLLRHTTDDIEVSAEPVE